MLPQCLTCLRTELWWEVEIYFTRLMESFAVSITLLACFNALLVNEASHRPDFSGFFVGHRRLRLAEVNTTVRLGPPASDSS